MRINECFGSFRSTKCDLQTCCTISQCEDYSNCLADRVKLLTTLAERNSELADLRQGICQLSGCSLSAQKVGVE